MKLIVGLGNPGKKFTNNRHNVGHVFIEKIRDMGGVRGVRVFETDCFMNESGKFVKRQVKNRSLLKWLYIVHDDLDILLGKYKIQFGVGPKVHYGIQSVENELGTKEFWRIRIGVDNRPLENREPGDSYVLKDFTSEELEILKGVFDAITRDDSFPR